MVEAPFENTYSWLFQNTVRFEDWLSGTLKSPIYWIQGKPGSGKSTVMKYAMQNNKTPNFLARYHRSDWIIAGFFFHDRGSMAQKSLSSMLREVLFEIMQKRRHLIRPLLKLHPSGVRILGSGDETSITITWKQEDIEKALSSVTSLEQLNLCLFIDALDEHEGNHRTLLAAINRLQELCDHRQVCLRLCLSSRPENVFQHAFRACPGFAIHEWTKQDILKYIQNQLEDIADDFGNRLHELLEEISQKARGVFIWVRLVVDELLEGWNSGDNIGELIDMLSMMPPELEGLYERTLRRPTRLGMEATRKHRREAFIMFEIALRTDMPLNVDDFLSIASHCSRADSQDDKLTFKQKCRRVRGRCFGLLEVVPVSFHDIDGDNEVQFIHQTTKDFFMTKKGFDVLLAGIGDIPVENGHTYILRYSVSAIIRGAHFQHFFLHAHKAEMVSHKPSVSYILRELHDKRESLQCLISKLLLAEGVNRNMLETLIKIGDNDLSLLVMSVCACLPLSVAECLESLAHMPKRYAGIALRATIYDTASYNIDDFDTTREILKSLLETGMDADSVFTNGETSFAALIVACKVPQPELHEYVIYNVERKIQLLSTLVHHGADPNQAISFFFPEVSFVRGLHLALYVISPEDLVSALLSFGADASLPDSEGYLALFYAIAWDKQKIVRILLRNKARACHLNALGLCALAPKLEDFRLSSISNSFAMFEEHCLLLNNLFLEADIKHEESCKHFRSEPDEVE